jgi:pimeloyl-ACP methyl ester carboxylesterase
MTRAKTGYAAIGGGKLYYEMAGEGERLVLCHAGFLDSRMWDDQVGALDHPEILRAADVMAGAIKGAKKVVIPDSAHVPNMEQPEAFNRAVLEFLERVGRA